MYDEVRSLNGIDYFEGGRVLYLSARTHKSASLVSAKTGRLDCVFDFAILDSFPGESGVLLEITSSSYRLSALSSDT